MVNNKKPCYGHSANIINMKRFIILLSLFILVIDVNAYQEQKSLPSDQWQSSIGGTQQK